MKKVLVSTAILLSGAAAFADSTVSAGGMRDYANVTITGDAAKSIYNGMGNIKEQSVGPRTAAATEKRSGDIVCYRALEGHINYTCKFSVDKNGAVRSDFLR